MPKKVIWRSPEAKKAYQERKKNTVIELLHPGLLRWRDVKKELPNRETPYASKYGVSVLGFDLDEYLDSSCQPTDLIFNFESKKFEAQCTNGSFIPVGITHWLPMPPIPARQKSEIIAESPLGFKYYKDSDKVAKAFVKLGKKK